MKRINRRNFLSVSGTLVTGAILSACGDSPTATPSGSRTATTTAATSATTAASSATTAVSATTAATTAAGTTTTAAASATMPAGAVSLRWWDHYAPLEAKHNQIFADFSKQYSNVKVEHQIYNLPQLGQSLQLAFNSKQAPDVHAIASLNIPAAQLVANNWFVPLDSYVSADFKKRFPEGSLLEGLHTFGGNLYSFPLFGFRSHATLLWFDKQLMTDAGGDPENGPKTWEDFRDISGKMAKKGQGQYFGWIQAIQLAKAVELAQAVETLRQNPAYREKAGRIQQTMREAGGYQQAAEEILWFKAQHLSLSH